MSRPETNNFAEERLNEEKEDDNAGNEPSLKRVFKDTPYQGNLSPTNNEYNLLSHLLLSLLFSNIFSSFLPFFHLQYSPALPLALKSAMHLFNITYAYLFYLLFMSYILYIEIHSLVQ